MRFFFAVCLAMSISVALGDDRSEMHDILQANFDACNREDVDALMETCSLDMPGRGKFRKESEIIFREKDIHYSMEDFKVTKISGDYAEAWVVQRTYADDRTSDSEERATFRNGTTLLPEEECVEYFVSFKRENGRWKCLETISEPKPYERRAPARR